MVFYMSSMTLELIGFGLIAIVCGFIILYMMLRDMVSADKHKWFLGIGLGSGIIAFSLKILFIVTFDSFPKEIVLAESHAKVIDINYPTQPAVLKYALVITQNQGYTWKALPRSAPFPKDNPITLEKIQLGKKLFFDKRLSVDNTISCASCHVLSNQKGGADGRRLSMGVKNQQGKRNAPTVLNAAFQRRLFWDGRAHSLEQQAQGPLINPVEMGMPSLTAVENKIRKLPEYISLFKSAFFTAPAITIQNISKAIATYERTLITPDSAYDRFVRGDKGALTKKQLRGMSLFESTGCIVCHSGPNFSGASVFNRNGAFRLFPSVTNRKIELQYNLTDDLGAAANLKNYGRGVWRIPSLRNVSRTAPYFHNGSVKKLTEAVRIMAQVQLNKIISNQETDDKNIIWSSRYKQLGVSNNHALSDAEINDIVDFLSALDGELPNT